MAKAKTTKAPEAAPKDTSVVETPAVDETQTPAPEETTSEPTLDLEALKEQAEILGIKFHAAIKAPALAAKIKERMGLSKQDVEDLENDLDRAKTNEDIRHEKGGRKKLIDEATKMVRINITCMNPAKKELPGEFFSVGNSVVPAQRRFVPFNTTDGWHVPHIMYEAIRDRMCQVFVSEKMKNGQSVRRGKMIREFAIEVMDSLSEKELEELRKAQALKRGE